MRPANGGAEVADLGAVVSSRQRSVLDALWETVPAEMRATRLSPKALSAEYSGAFIWSASHGFTIDLSPLPVTMQRELSWCMFRTVERGGRIALANVAMFARWLGSAVADLGAGAPSSLTGLSVQDWEHQFALSVQHPQADARATAVAFACPILAWTRRAVLRVHAREPGRRRDRVERTAMAAAGSRARRLLPVRGAAQD